MIICNNYIKKDVRVVKIRRKDEDQVYYPERLIGEIWKVLKRIDWYKVEVIVI